MKTNSLLGSAVGFLIALSSMQFASAQIPRNLTIQGVLTDSTSKPVQDGIHTITLRLYDKLFGGNIVHTEEFTTPVLKGLFNLTIGSKTPIPSTLTFDKQYFVGISYDGKSEIARIPLSSVPYSLMAETVPDGSITTNKIADGSITIDKLSVELRNEKKSSTGLANSATGPFAFIGGGDNNVASGSYSSVVGGFTNKAQANYAIAAGGFTNIASAVNATVSGGSTNTANASYAVVGGGLQNLSSGTYSSNLGGNANTAFGNYSSVTGGQSNSVSASHGVVSGGQGNSVASQFGVVGGGYSNAVSATSNSATISGGYDNMVSTSSPYAVIGGGFSNNAAGASSVIGGGNSNVANGLYSSILGGKDNTSSGTYAFIGGGLGNNASGNYSSVNGGNGNTASGHSSSVNGGSGNLVSGENGAIIGGINNSISAPGAIAIGSNISISSPGTGAIVIGNGGASKLSSTVSNSLSIGFGSSFPTVFVERAQSSSGIGRVGFGNTNPTSVVDINGAITLRNSGVPDVAPPGQGRIYFDNATGKFKGSENGGDYQNLFGGGGGGGGWLLTGNAGIIEGTNYVGPSNNVYLELRAGDGCGECGGNSTSITRLRLNTNGSIQRFGDGDARGDNAIDFQDIRDLDNQVASGQFSVISGGVANTASEYGSTVGGGESNEATGIYSTISGGNRNLGTGFVSYIGGGQDNQADGGFNSVLGGAGNIAEFDASFSSILGGAGNTIGGTESGTAYSSIIGGDYNTVTRDYSVILGGTGLRLDGTGSLGFHANHNNESFYDRGMTVGDDRTFVLGNVDVWLANNDYTPRSLRFYERYDAPGDFPNGANFVGFKAPNSIDNNVTWTLPNADGTPGQVLNTDGSGVLSWGAAGGLVHFVESENITTPNDVGVPVVQLLAVSEATNVDVALTPKGTGALLAQIPDNTAVGGNKRGEQAVDWQMLRSLASQVASGAQATISGGLDNTASGSHSVVAGGYSNISSNDNSTVGGGLSNTASQVFTTVSGGVNNTASETYASVSGGQGNTASGNSSVVGGGESNTSNASHSTVGGGQNNTASNSGATIAGGLFNSAPGIGSAIGGGWSNYADAYSAIPGGVGLLLDARSFGYNANMDSSNFNVRPINISAPNTAVFNNVDFWLTNNDNTTRSLRFYEQYNEQGSFPNGTNFVGFKAPNAIASDVVWTLPDADGTIG